MKESPNAIVVSNGKLDVTALMKATAGIKLAPLSKHAADCVEWLDRAHFRGNRFHDFVQVTQDRTIEKAENAIRIWLARHALVFWNW